MAKMENACWVIMPIAKCTVYNCFHHPIHSSYLISLQYVCRFNGREGLILYTVNYNDGGTRRPILYRASLAEMFVPYGDPRCLIN